MKFISESKGLRFLMIAGSLLMLILILIFSYKKTDHEREFLEHLTFQGEIDGQCMELKLWKDELQDCYYLFLPSCFNGENSRLTVCYDGSMGKISINNESVRNGAVLDNINDESIYQVQLIGPLGVVYADKSMQILISENLPTMMITAEAEELLTLEDFENKKYVETGDLVILDEKDGIICAEELKKFKIRGNLTATLDKKPFKISFNRPVELLGMAPAVNWTLLANATDGSYIRNKLVLDLANSATDDYEPDGEFVELYLNGSYQGLYLLTEAVEIGENRLNISAEDHYLLEMELDFRQEENSTYLKTERGQLFEIELEGMVSEKEEEQVRGFLNDIESALFSEDGTSEISGKPLEELIDFDSWAVFWLVNEISGDHDTGIASQFAYTSHDPEKMKLYAGPVWDFDGTMGNVNTPLFGNPQALIASIEQSRPEGNANQNRWLAAMYRNEKFRQKLEEKYTQIFDKQLQAVLNTNIDGYVETIRRSACLDALRWHEKRLSWQFVLPHGLSIQEQGDYHKYDTLDENVAMVREFLSAKREFLYGLFTEHRDYCVVEVRNDAPFLNQDYNQTIYYWVEKGTAIEGLPLIQKDGYEFYGYTDCSSGEKIENGTIIDRDCVVAGNWMKNEQE